MRSHVGLRRYLLWGLFLAFALALALPASASIIQLTSDATHSSDSASISADGSKIAFESNADLTGGNSDHSDEIFVMNSDGTGLLQLTNGTDPMNEYSWGPSISGDGSVVVFVSNLDLVTGQNSDGTLEVFLVNSDGTGMLQLTSHATLSCDMPAISADGSKVVFVSSANWTGGNADGSSEIFVIDSDGNNLTRLTAAPLATDSCCMPSISADGSKVVFQSNGVLIGSANLDKSMEIFAVNSNGTGLTQLTNEVSASYWSCMPKISGDGSKVTFASDADLATGNSDHSEEIFVIDSGGTTGLAQLTSSSVAYDSDDPCINGDGSVVVFESSADLTGGNGDFSDEIFVVNSDGTGLTQLTSASPASIDSQNPCITADGSIVVFDSEADLAGGNSDNNEDIFLVTWGDVSAGEPWISLAYETDLTPTSVPIPTDYTEPAFPDVDTDYWAWAQIEECAVTATAAEDFIVQGYGDGSYQPTWQVTRAQMAVFIARAAGYTDEAGDPSFQDVPDSYWAFEEVEQCVANGVVKGYADYFGEGLDAYLPAAVVDRAQMAVYIFRAINGTTAAYDSTFDDVADDFWAALEIEGCAALDIVQGYGGGIYLPENKVTRSQMAVFVWRALVRGDGDVVLGGPAVTDDAAWDPGGDDTGRLFYPTAVGTATGANIVDSEDEDLPVEPGAVVFVVLDAAQVGDGFIDYELFYTDDNGTPDDPDDDFMVEASTGAEFVIDDATCRTAVNNAGGVPYLVASYQIDSNLDPGAYTLVLTLPNRNVTTWEFTVE